MTGMSHELPRCGRIAYTNDLPVYTAIDQNVLSFPGTMIADVPSHLNAALLEGELDVSPISSAFWAEHADELVLLPDVCIGAHDEVHSMCCISAREPKGLAGEQIAVTRESVTGRTLLRVICRSYYGFDPVTSESDDPFASYLAVGSPCLLIGDKAIDAAEQAPQGSVHDLGLLWHQLTGRGMVYAVWAARKEYALQAPDQVHAVALALRESLAWGLENIHRVVARAQTSHPRAPGFYELYYRALHFRFDEEARSALEAFVAAVHGAGLIGRLPSSPIRG